MAVGGKYKNSSTTKGSDTARAVSKGMKEKELDDSVMKGAVVLSLGLGLWVWSLTGMFVLGLIIFFVLLGVASYWYYKE